MDTTSTEAAFGTANLGAVAFSWSDGDTILTIDPNSNLEYAAGNEPDTVAANEYTFSIAQTATDTGGNALEEQSLSNFFTARAITETLAHDPAYSGAVASNDTEQTGTGGDPVVGDHSDNPRRKGFIGYSLASLPGGILDVLDAQLVADQWLTLGAPFSFGSIGISHVAAEELPGGLFNAPAARPWDLLQQRNQRPSHGQRDLHRPRRCHGRRITHAVLTRARRRDRQRQYGRPHPLPQRGADADVPAPVAIVAAD